MKGKWPWLGVGMIAGSLGVLYAQSRISPAMPPVPPLPTVTQKADMPAALPVSEGAPHHYYGIVEFKSTKDGIQTENEVFYFGLYPDEASFRRSHGVGNTRFNKKFKAVFKYPSELPLDATCVWQRREGFGP